MKTQLYNSDFIIQNSKHVESIEEMDVWTNFLVMFSSLKTQKICVWVTKTRNAILVFSSHEIWISMAKLLLWCIIGAHGSVLSCQTTRYCWAWLFFFVSFLFIFKLLFLLFLTLIATVVAAWATFFGKLNTLQLL